MHVDKISLGKEYLKFQMQMKFSRIFKQHLHDDENRVSHYKMIYKESIFNTLFTSVKYMRVSIKSLHITKYNINSL